MLALKEEMKRFHKEQSPNQLPQNLPILKYTRQREIEIISDVIDHQPMLPAKCYCFAVAKTNAAITLERVTNAQLLCLQAERRRQRRRLFHGRSTGLEHCQTVRSVNSAM